MCLLIIYHNIQISQIAEKLPKNFVTIGIFLEIMDSTVLRYRKVGMKNSAVSTSPLSIGLIFLPHCVWEWRWYGRVGKRQQVWWPPQWLESWQWFPLFPRSASNRWPRGRRWASGCHQCCRSGQTPPTHFLMGRRGKRRQEKVCYLTFFSQSCGNFQ